MTKQEKHIPELLNSHEYMWEFFNQRVKQIDPQAKKILHLSSHPIKAHRDEKFFHYVIEHKITLGLENGLRRRCTVMCISFSQHRRRKMYQVLELAYQHGFNKNLVTVPQPLWYINKLMALFYIAVPGDNLLEHIKNGHLDLDLIKKLAQGLAKFHQLKIPKNILLEKHKFSLNYLDPTQITQRDYNQKTLLNQDVHNQFKRLKQAEKILRQDVYLLSHGDFHPENVIINRFNTQHLVIIDFSEACLAPIYYDLGSFLQQLSFMTLNYLTPEEQQQVEYTFLSTYFNRRQLDQYIYDRINLYKAWTALKSVVYFMVFEDKTNRKFAEFLLTQSEDFYRQIKEINS